MRPVLFAALLALAGCGEREHSGGGGGGAGGNAVPVASRESVPFVHINPLMEAYTRNPASADQKYKGRTIETKMPWLEMEQAGGRTILRAGRVVYRFVSEAEAAKVETLKWYRVRGVCEGLKGDDLVIADVRIVSEWQN